MSSETINGVTWNIVDGIITSASDYGSNVIVPGTVDGITVVGFSNQIFKTQTTIQTISIPDSVTSLPTEFFGDVNNNTLTSVTFTENSQLTTIGLRAFKDCLMLTDFKIPSTVTTFSGTHQFQTTAMSSVTIPAGLVTIGEGAFYNMPNLTELIFAPNSNLDEFAQGYGFTNCVKLDVIINFPAQNFPDNSKFDSTTFQTIGPNPVVILSEETTDAQADAFIANGDITGRFTSSTTTNVVTFYKRPLTDPNISTLLTANVTVAQLRVAGATLSQLQTGGASITALITGGFTVQQLLAESVSIDDLLAAGVTVQQLLDANVSQIEIDIAVTQIKIHTAFTINEGESNESVFTTDDAVYTPTTFAAKLTTDLGYAENTITVVGDSTTTDDTPYYRLYLQFAQAVTLTNMPKDIFNIPFSDFSVKAGGQVNLRNVNLDADMTIATSYEKTYTFENHTVVECNASDNNKPIDLTTGEFARYTNKLYDPSFFGSSQFAEVAFSQTSIFAVSTGSNSNINKVFELDENETYGMKQLGDDLAAWTDELVLSGDGLTVAMTYKDAGSHAGLMNVFRRNLNEDSGWESINDVTAGDLTGPAGQGKQRYASLSGDGNKIALGCSQSLSKVRVFEYSGSGQNWTQLGTDITVPGTNHPVKISKDGNILCVMSVSASSVSVYERDTNAASGWSQIGSTITNLLEKIALNKNGDIFASFKSNSVISVYKRDTNDASGWSLMADITKNGYAVQSVADNTLSLDDDGHTLTCGSPRDGDTSTNQGVLYFFKYNTTTSTWGPVVTNNTPYTPVFPIWANQIDEGGTGPIFGESSVDNTVLNMQFAKFSAISGDGIHVIATNINQTSFMYIYKLPYTGTTSNTSTIPAGNNFINNFVSTIETDLNFPLSYDISNALITFDGLAQDISMNITSNDTTVFDTSITEITTTDKTLPFITYGQPDPTLQNYSDNGITVSEFVSNGYTIPQLYAGGIVPDWTLDTDANHFAQSYVKDFIDISGSLVLRENTILTVNGNIETKGNITIKTSIMAADLSLNHNMFVGGDISMNGNVTVGDISMNGKVVGCSFTDASIEEDALNGTIPAPDYTQPILYEKGFNTTADVSMNANVQINNLKVDGNIEFSDETMMNTYDDNISPDYTIRTPNYVAGTGIPATTYIHDTTDLKSLSSDGKYILVVGGHMNNNPYVNDSDTNKSGICLSSDYGITYAFFHLKHPDNGTDLTRRSYRTSAMSGDGKYMLVFISGSGSSMSTDMVYGISRNYGTDWTTYWQSTLPGNFLNQTLFPRSVSLNYDGSEAYMHAIGGGGKVAGVISHNFMEDWVSLTKPEDLLESRIIGNYLVYKKGNYIYFDAIGTGTNQIYAAKKIGYATAVSNVNDVVVILCNGTAITKLIVNGDTITESIISSINTQNYNVSPMVSPSGKYVIIGQDMSLSSMYSDLRLFTSWNSKVYCSSDYGQSFTTVSTGIIDGSFPGDFHTESSVTDTGFIFVSAYYSAGKNIIRYGSFSLFNASTFESLTVNGLLSVGSFVVSSDYRIKTDISQLDETFTLDNLRPVKYVQTLVNKPQYGLIAHELQQYYPDLVVGEKDGEELQRVNYTGLIALLINEIKQLKHELTELENGM